MKGRGGKGKGRAGGEGRVREERGRNAFPHLFNPTLTTGQGGAEFDGQVPPSAACANIWSSRLVSEAIEPHRALLRREETGASEVLTVSDVGSTSHGESAGWPGSSGSIPSMAGGLS